MKPDIEGLEQLWPAMVSWRRHLHQHPELSFQEERTAGFVAERLAGWGIEVRRNVGGGHGLTGTVHGSGPGPLVALRADMDALPIQDEKECEYASKTKGVMHACGHDAHTSTLLGLAQWLSEHRGEWNGSVRLIFQPAEEVRPGGAVGMIEDGVLDGVDVIYGVHLWAPLPVGAVYCREGPMMAGTDEFQLEVIGQGGHAGLPQETVDSVVVGAHLIVNLQSIVSRQVGPTDSCVVTVGAFQGGSGFNVIAGRSVMQGTIRIFDESLRPKVLRRFEEIAAGTCSMFGASHRLDCTPGYPPVVNHAREAERFFKVAGEQFGEERARVAPQIMAAEDFAYYLKKVPGCFMFVGAGNADKGMIHPHHHPKFDIDERAMGQSARLLLSMALDYLDEHGASK